MKHSLKNSLELGFSLAQTMVGVGVASVIALGVAASISSAIEGNAQQRAFNSAEEATNLISGLLGDSDFCSKNFSGKSIPTSLPGIAANDVSLKIVDQFGNLGTDVIIGINEKFQTVLTVKSLSLQVQQSLGPNRYIGSLNAEFISTTKASNRFFREIPMFISTTTTGQIERCGKYSQPAYGTNIGIYSITCDDFATRGWSSKDQCLQDGRWHLVYSHTSAGATTFGSKANLIDHLRNGANVKAGFTPGTFGFLGGYEVCTAIVADGGSGHIGCMGTPRRGINPFNPPTITNEQNAVYFSTGLVSIAGGGNANGGLSWYIQY